MLRLEQWVALVDHSSGKDSAALELILDLLGQADTMGQASSFYLFHLLPRTTEARAVYVLNMITPDLAITADQHPPPVNCGAGTGSQVREVIAHLLDERGARDGSVRMFDGIRLFALDDSEGYAAGQNSHFAGTDVVFIFRKLDAGEAWTIRPMVLMDASRMTANFSFMRSAAAQPNWPAAGAIIPQIRLHWYGLQWYTDSFTDTYGYRGRDLEMTNFSAMADRRAAAIALALRLYCFDHRGQLPAQLPDLVPDYLPTVPIDPMAADGRPFAYHPDAHPPVIYSVGSDGIDNRGMSLPDDITGGSRWDKADAVYPLGPLPPKKRRASGSSGRPATGKAPSPG